MSGKAGSPRKATSPKKALTSRKASPSRNAPSSRKVSASPLKIDRRVRRTRDALGDALVGLMHEKPFNSITVQHVLDRANVGRSTFYTHYSDKDDLFLRDVEEFWEAMATVLSRQADSSDRIAPVRELFAHAAETRQFYAALVASGRIHDVWELGQGHFARGIEQRLAELPRARGIATERRVPFAHALAGALMSLMSWWIDHGLRGSPADMDDLYHHMVWCGVSG